MIVYVDKEKIEPYFGYAYPEKGYAYVQRNLPILVRDFVTTHELYHLKDKANSRFWREIKANVVAGFYHPIGFTLCLIMSLSTNRLKLYYQSIKGVQP